VQLDLENQALEVQRLRRGINDLVSLLALPAIWSGSEPSEPFQIVGTLLDAVLGMLRLEFVYARLNDAAADSGLEAVRIAGHRNMDGQASEVGRTLEGWLQNYPPTSPWAVPHPAGTGKVKVAHANLGIEGEIGLLVAGSDRADFPTEIEMLVLKVAANQAAIALERMRLLRARTQAEESVRRTKQELSDFVENASVGMHWVGPDGVILWANSAELEMLGYAREEYIGRHIAEFHCERPVIEDILGRLAQGETLHEYAAQLRCKDGSIRDVLINSNVFWEDNKFVHTRCFTRDITERKKIEEDVRRRTAQFETLLNEAPLGVYLVDSNFRLRQVNPTALRTFGNIPDLIGRDFGEVIKRLWPETYASEIIDRFHHTLETGEPYIVPERMEMRLDREATEFYEWQINRIPLPEGGYGVVCYFRDISQQVLARQAIEQSEERFRSLVSVITNVPWTADAHGAFVTEQPAWQAYTGQTWEDYRDFGWENAVHPEDRDRVKEIWKKALEKRTLYETRGRLWHAPSQQWRHYVARGMPLLNTDGDVREWIGACTDVDDQKRAEEERERLLQSEHEARTQAEAANRFKDEFLATVSHELRTPLNAILGWSHMLVRGRLDEENTAHGLEVIERNARAQNQLIADLLDISRIITGKFRFEPDAVELIPTIKAAVETVRPAVSAKGIDLRLQLDPAAGPISGDANRLQQIVWNLLSNAVKYTPRNGRIEVQSRRQDSSAVIIVKDTGEGITPDFLPYIFDRFRQADASTTRHHGGLGLGLAIVRHLVELHGGTVFAASKGFGQGTTFTVTLPLLVAQDAAKRTNENGDEQYKLLDSSKSASANLRHLRVLIVDDEPDAREVLMLALSQTGAAVRAAATVSEALEVFDEWKPSVLVSDIGMPSEDGYDLIRRVRARDVERGGRVPALALTGYASAEDAARVVAAGYQTHLAKPVAPSDLVNAVATLVEFYKLLE
jgi:PAS domain S-box-containing protein